MSESNFSPPPDLEPYIKRMNLAEASVPREKTLKLKKTILAALLGVYLLAGTGHHEVPPPPTIEHVIPSNEVPGFASVAMIDVLQNWNATEKMHELAEKLNFQPVSVDVESVDHSHRLLTDDAYAQSYLLEQIIDEVGGHGSNMGSILETGSGSDEKMQVFPLQAAITDTYFKRDELGNPVVGVYINPEVISRFIKESGAKYVNMSFQVGWTEYTAVSSERYFPEMTEYTLNGETVYAEESNATISTDGQGQESLIQSALEEVDTASLSPAEKATFLVTQASFWTQEEYDFLLEQGSITEAEAYWDDIDLVYYNESEAYLFPPGTDNNTQPVRQSSSGSVFLVDSTTLVKTFTAEEAQQAQTEGVVRTFDSIKDRRHEAYSPDTTFETPTGPLTNADNQAALYDLALQNPDTTIVASLGNLDSKLNPEGRPDNLLVVGLYMRGATLEGADLYVYPDEDEDITSSSASAALVTNRLAASGGALTPESLMASAEQTQVWRNTIDGSYEETILLIH
jgi:hypothetical protein